MEENHKTQSQSRRGSGGGKKKEIETLLASHRKEIEAGQLKVLLLDECHLLWGDLRGYVWGKTAQEIAVPVVNEREQQTYYGAVDYLEGELLLKAYDAGNSQNTIDSLRHLLTQFPHQRLLIIWDGAQPEPLRLRPVITALKKFEVS